MPSHRWTPVRSDRIFVANSEDLQRIAPVVSMHNSLAAHLIEESFADAEGRRVAGSHFHLLPATNLRDKTGDFPIMIWPESTEACSSTIFQGSRSELVKQRNTTTAPFRPYTIYFVFPLPSKELTIPVLKVST